MTTGARRFFSMQHRTRCATQPGASSAASTCSSVTGRLLPSFQGRSQGSGHGREHGHFLIENDRAAFSPRSTSATGKRDGEERFAGARGPRTSVLDPRLIPPPSKGSSSGDRS